MDVLPGDFLAEVPAGGDAYLLSMVLHDWDDERASAILARCREAMAGRGLLLVYERVLPPVGSEPPWDPFFSDLNMLQGPGGRERTEAEWRSLLVAEGFALQRLVPTPIGLTIMEATVSAT